MKEELNTFKNEAEIVSRKMHELSEEELNHVTGGETVIAHVTVGLIGAQITDVDCCENAGIGVVQGAAKGAMQITGTNAQIETAQAKDMLITKIDM